MPSRTVPSRPRRSSCSCETRSERPCGRSRTQSPRFTGTGSRSAPRRRSSRRGSRRPDAGSISPTCRPPWIPAVRSARACWWATNVSSEHSADAGSSAGISWWRRPPSGRGEPMSPELAETAERANDIAPTSSTERILAELLADVLRTDRVTLDGHFFDDLCADSLLMAQFCARVRRRDDLPAVSIKDVYRHPTIAGLVAAMTERAGSTRADPAHAAPTEAGAGESPQAAPRPPADTAPPATAHLLCGALQLLAFLGYGYLAALLFSWGSEWITAGSGALDTYVRSVAFGGLGFLAL